MPTADQKSGACKATFLLLVLTAERKNMNSFMSWLGGKKALRDAVLARFPPYYERYIEVFGGAGWVLFHKPPGMAFEVYNDFNGNLSNLYRCVRDKPNKLKYKLRYVLNSREDFDRIALLHKRGIFEKLCDADRASKFYQLIRYSYASGLDSFGSQPHSRNIMKKDHIKHLSCLIWSFYHIYSHLEIRVEKSKSATVNDNPASPFPFSSLLSHANISPSLVSSHKQLYFAQSFSSYTSVGSP